MKELQTIHKHNSTLFDLYYCQFKYILRNLDYKRVQSYWFGFISAEGSIFNSIDWMAHLGLILGVRHILIFKRAYIAKVDKAKAAM